MGDSDYPILRIVLMLAVLAVSSPAGQLWIKTTVRRVRYWIVSRQMRRDIAATMTYDAWVAWDALERYNRSGDAAALARDLAI